MNNIRQLRERAKISQGMLAQELGVSQQAVAQWEVGAADPRWYQAPALAKALNCPIAALFACDEVSSEATVVS